MDSTELKALARGERVPRIQAMMRFFGADGGRRLEPREIKAMSQEERQEIGDMIAEATGCEVV